MPPSLDGGVSREENEGVVEPVKRRELRGRREGMIHD
jgi:hypothetical protein